MKTTGSVLCFIAISLSAVAFGQSDAKTSFDKLKALAGSWEGSVTTTPHEPAVEGKTVQVTLRVTSLGNALLHEMRIAGRPDDPITMLYLDDNRLLLTHYCDAGNRPRMLAKMGDDGKTVEFNLLDVSGSTQYGHMHNALFSVKDPEHHVEEWSFMTEEGKPTVRAHFELARVK